MTQDVTYILEIKKVYSEVVTVKANSIRGACKKYKDGDSVMIEQLVLDSNFVSVTPEN